MILSILRKATSAAALGFALLFILGGQARTAAQDWALVWSDEFDGPQIDATKWTHEVNATGGGNNELQYYVNRAQNSFIRDGKLVIRAIKESYMGPEGTRNYTSARLNSRYKGDFLYGRFEARLKLPGDQGLWPAFWLLPTDWEYGGWAASGEVDIMEHRGDLPTTLYGTLHYGGQWPNNTYSGTTTTTPDLTLDFHEFAVEWEPGVFRWYFDGELYLTKTDWYSSGGAYPAPFDKRFHLLLNLAVGGNFLPDPPADADYFPKEYEIDYVRVYQRPVEQLPFGGSARSIPGIIQAEDFDEGGPLTAYFDSDGSNNGPSNYRPGEGVDLEAAADAGGGVNVGWMAAGEWMEYTITVPTAGVYEVDARVAAQANPGNLTLRFDDGDSEVATTSTTFTPTGAFQAWKTVSLDDVTLPSGTLIMRFEANSTDFNLNYFELRVPVGPPVVPFSGFILDGGLIGF